MNALAPVALEALRAALDAVPAPALVLDRAGRVRHANGLGRALVARSPDALAATLADVAAGTGGPADVSVTRLEHDGHLLAVFPAASADATARAAAAAVRWGLSERQREVLEQLAVGRANPAIAAQLGCAVGTVELHVSAILRRAGAEGRTELVARFWTGT